MTEIKFLPLVLNMDKSRSIQGWPILADEEGARKIIKHVAEMSEPFGTEITYNERQHVGIVKIP